MQMIPLHFLHPVQRATNGLPQLLGFLQLPW
jgi:hypothetical protein